MKVLITGACGFIGRTLATALESRHELWLLDRVRPEEATIYVGAASPTMRAAAPMHTDLPFIQAEITDSESMCKALEGIEAVIHLAGEPRGLPEIGVETFRSNALGTFVILDAARRAGVSRFLCASSINAFGTFFWRLSNTPVQYEKLPLDEEFSPVPEDPYSLSKLVNEQTCAAFHRAYGITTAAFRFAAVWSTERYEGVVEHALPPTTTWSDDLYQWVHIADVIQGISLALESLTLPGAGVYTLNAADTRCLEPTTELLARFHPDLLHTLTAPLEGRAALLSIERARQAFGYSPRYRLGP
ncbi:MAG: NAD-dependent epimerase/dehydratase family protein [Aggregatilineales bacterium]